MMVVFSNHALFASQGRITGVQSHPLMLLIKYDRQVAIESPITGTNIRCFLSYLRAPRTQRERHDLITAHAVLQVCLVKTPNCCHSHQLKVSAEKVQNHKFKQIMPLSKNSFQWEHLQSGVFQILTDCFWIELHISHLSLVILFVILQLRLCLISWCRFVGCV